MREYLAVLFTTADDTPPSVADGAYYYYQTEPGKDYEDTLLDVATYAQQQKIVGG